MECRTMPQWQEARTEKSTPCENEGLYADWFGVPGDLDDFIFYGEEQPVASTR